MAAQRGGQDRARSAPEAVVQCSGLQAGSDENDVDLLGALRRLPEAFPMQPVQWVPRRSRQLAGAVLKKIWEDANAQAAAQAGDCQAEISHRLLRAAGQILFRPATGDDAKGENEDSSTAKEIRGRLKRAAAGAWLKLVEDCLDDIEKISLSRPVRQQPVQVSAAVPISDGALQAAAFKSRCGSDKGACQILTGGPPVPAGPETEEKIRALFRTEQLSHQERSELEDALAAAATTRRRPKATPQHASRAVARLQLAAGPGPSGFRNSFIALVHAMPGGPTVLATWATTWVQAIISPWLAELWTAALVRPFFKADMVSIRPILCAEALLKLAVGIGIRIADRQLSAAYGDSQFGAGRRGGAEKEVAEVRAAASLEPDKALMSLDVQNAFGAVQWKDALLAVAAAVPKLGPLLAVQWHACKLRLWVQDANGQGWRLILIYGSLLQGGLDGHPIFCLVMAVFLDRLAANQIVAVRWAEVRVWDYVDDLLFQCPVSLVATLLQAVEAELRRLSLRLQARKCRIHIPSLASTPVTDWPAAVRELGNILTISEDGVTILGTEGAGEYALPLGPWSAAAAETRKRAAQASALVDAAMELIKRPPPAGGKQVAWRIVRNIVTHSLDYDARVLTSSLVLPHASLVEQKSWELVEAVLGEPLTEAERNQIELPTHLGGFQMPMPTSIVPLARAAGIMETGPHVRAAVAQWGFSLDVAKTVDGVDQEVRSGIFDELRQRGVHPGPRGLAAQAPAPALSSPDLLRPPAPDRHLLSSFLGAASAASFQMAMAAAGQRDCARLLSAGGQTAGKSLTAPAGLQPTHFSDEIFTEVLRWRLGKAQVLPSLQADQPRCHNRGVRDGDCCESLLDVFWDHAAICGHGPLRNRRHNNYADEVGELAAETGGTVRREAPVAELTTENAEAILDVWCFGCHEMPDLLLDITIRHPAAASYLTSAAATPGFTAESAEKDKISRYPPRKGRSVVPFAVETWGRLGNAAEEVLQKLAAAATRHAWRRGQCTEAGSRLKRWRAVLDASLHRSMATMLLAARYGLPGKPLHRHRGGAVDPRVQCSEVL